MQAMAAAPQTAEQQALVALQQEMADTRAQLAVVSSRFDQLAGAHQAAQAAHNALKIAHDQLRADAGRVLGERQTQIQDLERSLASLLKKQHCDLLDLKAMKPTGFSGAKHEKWKPWARKTKAYCNAKHAGFR